MRRHIERLKQEHPAVRSRFALLCAASVTAVVAIVWLTTLPVRFGEAISKTSGADATANTISALGNTIAPGLSQIQDAFSGSTPTGTPGIDITNNPGDMTATSPSTNTTNTQAQTGTAPTTYMPADGGSAVDGVDTSRTTGF